MVPYQKVPPAVVRVVVERAQPWCRARVIDGGLVKVLSVGVAHLGARNPARLCPVVLAAVRRRAGGLVDARAEKLPRGCTFVPCGPDRAAFLVVVQQLSSPPQLGGARLVRGIQAEAALGAPAHGLHAVDRRRRLRHDRACPPGTSPACTTAGESFPVMALATPFTFVLGHLVPAGYGSPAGGELLGVRCGDDHVTASCGVRGGRALALGLLPPPVFSCR